MNPADIPAAYGHLKLRHLRLLSLLESEGSVTRAASLLHVTQPAASAMLRELESLFGMELVQRLPQAVRLTPAAHAALRRFDIALAEFDAARVEAQLARDGAPPRLRVGALSFAVQEVLATALRVFLRAEPQVRLDIVEGTADALTGAILRGELDCVVGHAGAAWTSSRAGSQLGQAKLLDERGCVVARRGHPLARARTSLAQLAAAQWVLPPPGSYTRAALEHAFAQHGMAAPPATVESASPHSNISLAAATDLVTVVPQSLVARALATGELAQIESPLDLSGIAVFVMWRRTGEDDALVARFRDALMATRRRSQRRRERVRSCP
jgi:DNA-binding transcriptional LysR family regulator